MKVHSADYTWVMDMDDGVSNDAATFTVKFLVCNLRFVVSA